MAIRFAPARGGKTRTLARVLCHSVPLGAANDNVPVAIRSLPAASGPSAEGPAFIASSPGREAGMPLDSHLFAEAIYHFARHGLGAAEQARVRAEDAQAQGDTDACEHWIAVCRTFDRRMAAAIGARPACRA